MTDLDVDVTNYDAADYQDDSDAELDGFTAEQRAEADRIARDILTGKTTLPTEPPRPNREQRRAAEKAERRAAPDDQASPVEREANGVTVIPVHFDGETFWVPAEVMDWDPEAMLAFEQKQAMTALSGILEPQEDGTPGWKHFLAVKRAKGWRMRQVNELYEAIARSAGFRKAGN